MEALETIADRNASRPPRDDGAYVFHHPPKFLWNKVDGASRRWSAYHAYLHVPFCRSICTFCTFERKTYDKASAELYFDSLLDELTLRARRDDFSQAELKSVYLGGGTASLLTNEQIRRFLERLVADFGLRMGAECTLECEPGTKWGNDFDEIREAGVNRISIGVQSLSDDLLRALNRRHSADMSRRMIDAAQNGGFTNIHADLMYGLPGQSFAAWKATVDEIVDLGVVHISAYRLIVFQDELLARKLGHGDIQPPPAAEEIEDMRQYAVETFRSRGLERYSLTEFAKPGHECNYVQSNWNGSDYLGFGPAAYSRNSYDLWENTVFHQKYHQSIRAGDLPLGKGVTMTPRERLARDIAMGLCLLSVDLAEIERRAGTEFDETFHHRLRLLRDEGYLMSQGDRLRLTEKGARYATYVMKQFTE